jgi:hypothetical protein
VFATRLAPTRASAAARDLPRHSRG